MSARFERLLEYLDQPGVAEIMIGVDRPIMIRVDDAYRAVTQTPSAREQIATIMQGTSLAGMIDAPDSLPPIELEAYGRRLVVEVVRERNKMALRVSLAAQARIARATDPAPTRVSFTPPARTGASTPPGGFTVSGSGRPTPAPTGAQTTRIPVTPAPGGPARTTPPTGTRNVTTPSAGVAARPATTPPAGGDARAAPAGGDARPTTTPPAGVAVAARNATTPPSAARGGASTPPIGVAARGGASTPPIGIAARSSTSSPTEDRVSTTGTIPVLKVRGDASASDQAPTDPNDVEIFIPDPGVWSGPRIIDERSTMAALIPLVRAARQLRATDLHLAAGRNVMIRRVGELVPLSMEALGDALPPGLRAALSGPVSAATTQAFLLPLLGPAGRVRLGSVGYVDLAVDVPGAGRVRGNVSRQQDGLCGTFRLISQTTPTLDSLGLPRELAKVINHHQGLVVIAGPSGHGKTSTMAALVDLLNTTKKHHIITIEDPVEIEHSAKVAIVSHREVSRHTLSFVAALKASLREDPDVIVIGELRDSETVEIALTAAETGHLVLATMSTPSGAKTIDRLIDMFPPDDQAQVRATIAGTLRAIIAQRLLPTVNGDSVVPAIELVTGVLPLASLIRDNKLFQLPNLMQRGRAFGMIRLDDSLLELTRTNKISEASALEVAESKKDFAHALAQLRATPPPAAAPSRGLFGRKGRE